MKSGPHDQKSYIGRKPRFFFSFFFFFVLDFILCIHKDS